MHAFVFVGAQGQRERLEGGRGSVGMEDVRGRGDGPDADVSAVTLVAIEQQQGLPFPFSHWLASLTTSHVV